MTAKNVFLNIYYLKVFRIIGKYLYIINGKIPWSFGYLSYRNEIINKYILQKNLPDNYGYGLDERVVEYPWLLQNLPKHGKNILDAGSVLNYDFILKSDKLKGKNILISNLNPETEYHNDKSISYLYGVFGDLRNNIVKDEVFDTAICGSVLEHIGMDNNNIYHNKNRSFVSIKQDYLRVVKELKRVLKTNGTCLITVPFGKYYNFGWFQVFDSEMIKKIIKIFGERNSKVSFFKYTDKGWQISSMQECEKARYNDIHHQKIYVKNNMAAAESVACIKMVKR